MLKKIAILTITNNGLNYGNRLQNFALQKYLEQFDVEAENIISAKAFAKSLFLSKVRRQIKAIVQYDGRSRMFSAFDRKYIKNSPIIRYENMNEQYFAEAYDLFIAGSDQIWNPYFHFNSDFEFVQFAPEEKRYSYAASIGVKEITQEQRADFIRNINGMREISVREEEGAQLIKKLTGRDAYIHIDPTMLIPIQTYIGMEEKPKGELPRSYLLTYFLGEIPDAYRKRIEEIAKRKKLAIINLSESKGTCYYNCGPQNFLYFMHHAEYVCTDSFHGVIFSLLYEKTFSIFERIDNDVPMDSRIETLAHIFGINPIYDNMDIKMDYTRIKNILEKEQQKSRIYFEKILGNRA